MAYPQSHVPPVLQPGQFWFEYVGTGPIGAGGLGTVYRVRITQSTAPEKPVGSEWAIKRLKPQWAVHPVIRQRFEREIAALKRMSHENIVGFEGENMSGGERFYMMPLFSSSVRRHIASGNKTGDWKAIANYGAILADALQYAHDLGFVHRDIKPDNILFNPRESLKIADWGLGYFVHQHSMVYQHLTRGGMGTEYYCSIEQWSTGKCDGRGDIYALGMTLDEWITGRQRTINIGAGIGAGAPAGAASAGALAMNRLLQRMTAPRADARPASMREVAAQLRTIASSA